MNHYIFIATGNDTEQNGKERTEYRHEMLQVKAYTIGMTAREMRNELTRVCDLVTAEDCLDGKCPIDESCDKHSEHIPENMSNDEIWGVYTDLVWLGKFDKED